jgi:hypothetical protein
MATVFVFLLRHSRSLRHRLDAASPLIDSWLITTPLLISWPLRLATATPLNISYYAEHITDARD